jgi:hypothetical protein
MLALVLEQLVLLMHLTILLMRATFQMKVK